MPVPSEAALPPSILAKLAPIAAECGLTMPATIKILIESMAGPAVAEKCAPAENLPLAA